MANVTITVNDAALPRVVDALAARAGWPSEDSPGETKAQAARRAHAGLLRAIVRAHEADLAANTARQTAEQAVDAEISIT